MMKKTLFLLIFLPLAAASFAQDISDKYLYIEGTASKNGHYEFFLTNFKKEAAGAGFTATEKKDDAAHTLKFVVTPKIIVDEGAPAMPKTPELEEGQNAIKISLTRNSDNFEIISFDFFFTDLDEVYDYTKTLFHEATLYLQPNTNTDIVLSDEYRLWKNKWLYLRASFDYPVTFYLLRPTGLYTGVALFAGDPDSPDMVSPIDHKVMAMPGATVGFEFQFLDFMSLEINYQFSMGDTRNNRFVNMAFGAELKFPLKFFEHITFSPYAAFFYPLRISKIFNNYPPFAAGLGVQFSAKGGKHGAFFFDIKYLISFKDAIMHNPYLAYPPDQQLYPNPSVIHYRFSYIGIGVGYKIGFFDRKK